MAFSALKQCRSTMQGPLSIRSLASSTIPKFAASVTTTGAFHHHQGKGGLFKNFVATMGPAWPPIAVMAGMVVIAGSIGIHTAKQQFFHSPSVQVTKKKRECVPEVDYSDSVIRSANKFENKSFLRKVAHIQDKDYTGHTQAIPFSRTRECETLKSVGVRTHQG